MRGHTIPPLSDPTRPTAKEVLIAYPIYIFYSILWDCKSNGFLIPPLNSRKCNLTDCLIKKLHVNAVNQACNNGKDCNQGENRYNRISTHSERRPKLVIKDHIIYPYSTENKLMHLHFKAISITFPKFKQLLTEKKPKSCSKNKLLSEEK